MWARPASSLAHASHLRVLSSGNVASELRSQNSDLRPPPPPPPELTPRRPYVFVTKETEGKVRGSRISLDVDSDLGSARDTFKLTEVFFSFFFGITYRCASGGRGTEPPCRASGMDLMWLLALGRVFNYADSPHQTKSRRLRDESNCSADRSSERGDSAPGIQDTDVARRVDSVGFAYGRKLALWAARLCQFGTWKF